MIRYLRTYAAYWWTEIDGSRMAGEEKDTSESYDG